MHQRYLCPCLLAAGLALLAASGCAAGGPAATVDGGGGDSGACPSAPCDLVAQCGCDAPQVCDLDSAMLASGATTCRDVTVPGTETGNCTVSSECAGGYVCLGSPGQCRRFCDPSDLTACSDTGGQCLIEVDYDAGDGSFPPVPGVMTCSKECKPEAASNNGCPSSPQFGCRIFEHDPTPNLPQSGDEFFLTDCTMAPTSGGGDGAACTYGSDCAPGFGCVTFTPQGSDTPTSQCKQTCLFAVGVKAGPRQCDGGRTCTAFTNPALVVGMNQYGYCN